MATGRNTLTMALELTGASKVEGDLNSVSKSAEKAFAQIQKAAEKAGLSFDKRLGLAIVAVRAKLAALQAAGARLGQSFTTFTTAVNTFGTAVANSAKKIGLVTVAIGGAIAAIVKFAKSGSDAAVQIDKQAKALGLTTDQYQRLQTAAKNAELSQEQFEKILTNFNLTADDTKKSSAGVVDAMTGISESVRAVTVTAEDGTESIIEVFNAAGELGDHIKQVGSASKGTADDLLAYAKSIAALKDPHEQLTAVADRFGKKIALDTLPFLLELAKGLDATGDAARNLIAPLSEAEIAIGKNFDDALDDAGTNATRLKDRLALIFAPAVIEAAKQFNKVIFDNQERITAFAQYLATTGTQLVKDFFNALSGNDSEVQNKSIISLRDGIIEFGSAVKTVVTDIVVPAFNGLMEILDGVAAAINSVFGTEFTGKGILVTFVIAQIVGAFTVLGTALGVALAALQLFTDGIVFLQLVFEPVISAIAFSLGFLGAAVEALVVGLAAALGLPVEVTAAIVAAIAAAAIAIFVYWDEIVAAAGVAWEAIKAGAQDAFDAVKGFFSEGGIGRAFFDGEIAFFNRLWDAIKSGASIAFESLKSIAGNAVRFVGDLIAGVIQKIKDAASAVSDFFSQESAGESGGGGGFAGGGRVRGAGSGTSDSILARLSNGEFVIRASSVTSDTLPILHAINSGRVNLSDFLQRLQGFDLGGLVNSMNSRLTPRFVGGGLAAERSGGSQGRAVTVNFGGESFEMSASDNVVQKLMKAATGKQIRSNGRKPAWYGA
jgi:hypothetical protein